MPQFTQSFSLNAGPPPAFADDFTALSLFNTRNTAAGGTWEPSFWYATDGVVVNDSWLLNPFNPATPMDQVYLNQTGSAYLGVVNTPAAIAGACSNAPQLGGQIQSSVSFRQLHGYFEARFMLEKRQGLGAAFWLMQDLTWPPELDIIEITSPAGNNNDAWLGVYTIWAMDKTIAATSWTYVGPTPGPNWDPGVFHTYGVDWQANTTTWYIDRQQVFQAPTPSGYDQPMFPILTYNSGGDFAGPVTQPNSLPAYMVVDYVKVWVSKPF